jgi:Fe2+ transport system protein FeoA
MTLIIEPYEAIGPLHFGMRQDEIVASMGEPQRITKNHVGNTELWYDHMNVIMEDDRLVEVGFSPDMQVTVRGMNPFTDPTAFASLCRLDGRPCEVLGFIVLRKLGITLTGFHDKDESQKALTAFARGRWDVMETQMKPFYIHPTGR